MIACRLTADPFTPTGEESARLRRVTLGAISLGETTTNLAPAGAQIPSSCRR